VQTAYFVSDIHLVSPTEEKTLVFNRFLRSIREGTGLSRATHLFLVGDIFDLWVADHRYFAEKFSETVAEIRKLIEAGIKVYYFEGNHDLHLGRFWHDQVGVNVHTDASDFEIDGLKVRVEHGDLINPDDKGYLFLRGLLRSKPMTKLAHSLPSSLVRMIGERASSASRTYTSTAKELPKEKIRGLIRTHAERIFARDPFDLIITGHVHVEDDHSFSIRGKKPVRSVNLGSWFERPKAFVLDTDGGKFIDLT
jgi:UDP-2,3-diacylglucosamine hydrolase